MLFFYRAEQAKYRNNPSTVDHYHWGKCHLSVWDSGQRTRQYQVESSRRSSIAW